jgi:hypothetical protein
MNKEAANNEFKKDLDKLIGDLMYDLEDLFHTNPYVDRDLAEAVLAEELGNLAYFIDSRLSGRLLVQHQEDHTNATRNF